MTQMKNPATGGTVNGVRDSQAGWLDWPEHKSNPNASQDFRRGSMKDALGDKPYAQVYPDRPGFKTEGASQEAAKRVANYSATMRRKVLDKLREHPAGLTADELAGNLEISPLSARPRLSELRRPGEIVSTGERRKNESGMTATVWKIAPPPPWRAVA
jgi:hypothetical protein